MIFEVSNWAPRVPGPDLFALPPQRRLESLYGNISLPVSGSQLQIGYMNESMLHLTVFPMSLDRRFLEPNSCTVTGCVHAFLRGGASARGVEVLAARGVEVLVLRRGKGGVRVMYSA